MGTDATSASEADGVSPVQARLLFSILCTLFFALYFGPNVATFVLPIVSFPSEVRSPFHGLSAAAAKVGAMTGAIMFPIVNDMFGVSTVMALQAAICFAGAALSHFYLPSDGVEESIEDKFDKSEDSAYE